MPAPPRPPNAPKIGFLGLFGPCSAHSGPVWQAKNGFLVVETATDRPRGYNSHFKKKPGGPGPVWGGIRHSPDRYRPKQAFFGPFGPPPPQGVILGPFLTNFGVQRPQMTLPGPGKCTLPPFSWVICTLGRFPAPPETSRKPHRSCAGACLLACSLLLAACCLLARV